jgi:hypothetical protein
MLWLPQSALFPEATVQLGDYLKQHDADDSLLRAVTGFLVCPHCGKEHSTGHFIEVVNSAPDASVKCPACGISAVLYGVSAPTDDLTIVDVEIFRGYARYQATLWWRKRREKQLQCSFTCHEVIRRDAGYYTFNGEIQCAKCTEKYWGTDAAILEKLREDRNYFGSSMLDVAREWAEANPKLARRLISSP